MKKITFALITGALFIISLILFVADIATGNKIGWLDTMTVIFMVATLLSIPLLMLVSWVFINVKK